MFIYKVLALLLSVLPSQGNDVMLYKILSCENWEASQKKEELVLPTEDKPFVHFSTEEQLERIVRKYWANVNQFVVLKIDSSKLVGRLVLEANPGGTTKYYHLYDGKIPMNSIVDCKIISR